MLAPDFLVKDSGERLHKLRIESIVPNRNQVRVHFSEDSIRELAESIEMHGLMEPVIVRRLTESPTVGLSEEGGGERFELVAGERRYRAYKMLSKPSIPALVREVEDKDMRLLALLENLQREDLSLLEKAKAIRDLKAQLGSVDAVVKSLGLSRSAGFLYARIGESDTRYQTLIERNGLDLRRCDALLSLADRIKRAGDSKKLESFHHELLERPYSDALISELEQRYGTGEKGGKTRTAESTKGAERAGFWQTTKEFGLSLRGRKGAQLSKKERDELLRHAKQFFAALGAKKFHAEF